MQESGLTEIIPLVCISAIWSQYPVIFHILSSLVLTIGSGCSLVTARSSRQFFSSVSIRMAGITDDCNISFIDMATNIPFLTKKWRDKEHQSQTFYHKSPVDFFFFI